MPTFSSYKKLLNRNHLALILIIIVAFLLRSWDLGWNGFNGDESIYSGQAASLLGETEYLNNFGVFRSHPLLLQTLVSIAFALFGINDVVARIVPVLFGTLAVFITYLVGNQLFDRRVGLISCLVVALLPFHIIFSRQVLVDVPLSFFLILFIYFISKYRMTESNIVGFWAGVSSGLCIMSKEVGVITIPIFITYAILTRTLKLKKFLFVLAGYAFALSPYFFLTLTRQDAMSSFYLYGIWRTSTDFSNNILGDLQEYLSILTNEALGYVLIILIPITVFLIFKESKERTYGKYRDHIILLAITLIGMLILYSSVATPADRFVITFIPPATILGCAILSTSWIRHFRHNLLLYILIVPLIIFSNNYFLTHLFPIEDLKLSDNLGTSWKREAALWIKDNTPPDSDILTVSNSFANTIRFYANREVHAAENNLNPAYAKVFPEILVINKNVTVIADDLTVKSHTIAMKKYLDFFNATLSHTLFKQDINNGDRVMLPVIKIYEIQ